MRDHKPEQRTPKRDDSFAKIFRVRNAVKFLFIFFFYFIFCLMDFRFYEAFGT